MRRFSLGRLAILFYRPYFLAFVDILDSAIFRTSTRPLNPENQRSSIAPYRSGISEYRNMYSRLKPGFFCPVDSSVSQLCDIDLKGLLRSLIRYVELPNRRIADSPMLHFEVYKKKRTRMLENVKDFVDSPEFRRDLPVNIY